MKLLPFDQPAALGISADVRRVGRDLEFAYRLSGEVCDVVAPLEPRRGRADGLWQATCFEAFIGTGKTSYAELNFAPSGAWAAYGFTSYRQDMRELEVQPPEISFADGCLVARIALDATAGAPLNLAAVIEHRSGNRSYWALAHPQGSRPDFHSRDCFVAKLP
jgi:hypothetical protein